MDENNGNINQEIKENEEETNKKNLEKDKDTSGKKLKLNNSFNKNLTFKRKYISETKMSHNRKLIGEYEIKKTIGKGTFSRVKLGIHIITHKKVAIKVLDKSKIIEKEDLDRIIREMEILSKIDHPNVIKVYEISENEKNYYIIMEYCEGGELFNYIVKKQRLKEKEASIFYYQLINGLEYIHSKGIAHRDLKPENLLLAENKQIKIIDFGLSNFYDGKTNLTTPCGSPCYASPEMISGENYDGFGIDIWATGIILFAMLCGYLPFEDDKEDDGNDNNYKENYDSNEESSNSEESDNESLFNKILEAKLDYPEYLSEVAVDLLKKILVVDPKERITIEGIKKHKFYLMGKENYDEYNNVMEGYKNSAKELINNILGDDFLDSGNESEDDNVDRKKLSLKVNKNDDSDISHDSILNMDNKPNLNINDDSSYIEENNEQNLNFKKSSNNKNNNINKNNIVDNIDNTTKIKNKKNSAKKNKNNKINIKENEATPKNSVKKEDINKNENTEADKIKLNLKPTFNSPRIEINDNNMKKNNDYKVNNTEKNENMEEYKKKLFMNYLKSEIANRKNNKIFKNLKQNIKQQPIITSYSGSPKLNTKLLVKNQKYSPDINYKENNIPLCSFMDKNTPRNKMQKKKNYTFNQIVLDFNQCLNNQNTKSSSSVANYFDFLNNQNLKQSYSVGRNDKNSILFNNINYYKDRIAKIKPMSYNINNCFNGYQNNISNNITLLYNNSFSKEKDNKDSNKNTIKNKITISNNMSSNNRINTQNNCYNFIIKENNNKYLNFFSKKDGLKNTTEFNIFNHQSNMINKNNVAQKKNILIKPLLPPIKINSNREQNSSRVINIETKCLSPLLHLKTESNKYEGRVKTSSFSNNNGSVTNINSLNLKSNSKDSYKYRLFNDIRKYKVPIFSGYGIIN